MWGRELRDGLKDEWRRMRRSPAQRRRDDFIEAHPPAGTVPELVARGVDVGETVWLGEAPDGPIRAFWADDTLAWWRLVREHHRWTHLWPVMHEGDLGELFAALPGAGWEEAYDSAAELERGERMTAEQVLAELHERRVADGSPAAVGGDRPQDLPQRWDPANGFDEPGWCPGSGWVILVPVRHCWQALPVLGWRGGDVDGLQPAHHLALHRHWHERYGAELATLDNVGVLELTVGRPPSDHREARRLAWEFATYCPDLLAEPGKVAPDSAYADIAEWTIGKNWEFIWRWSY